MLPSIRMLNHDRSEHTQGAVVASCGNGLLFGKTSLPFFRQDIEVFGFKQ